MISFSSNVWFRSDELSEWERGCVTDMGEIPPAHKNDRIVKTKFSLEVQNERGDAIGEVVDILTKLVEGSFEEYELIKLRNTIDDDTHQASQVEDLITLNHLHEPAILTCLRARFDKNVIYTNTGPILIAVVCNIYSHIVHYVLTDLLTESI